MKLTSRRRREVELLLRQEKERSEVVAVAGTLRARTGQQSRVLVLHVSLTSFSSNVVLFFTLGCPNQGRSDSPSNTNTIHQNQFNNQFRKPNRL